MSLYNLINCVSPIADVALAALGLEANKLPRFRDAYLVASEDLIALYTRVGGSNRAFYSDAIASLQAHPLYVRDEDDPNDYTYATFYFRYPEEFAPALRAAASNPANTATPAEKMKALEAMKNG